MKTTLFRAVAVFFILLVATSVMMDVFKTEFGTVDFFERHGPFFLIFISFFPRLTLIFSSVATGGVFWWLGFIFCPRILVATLATVTYFHSNPILVTISWVIALGGETAEKMGLARKNKFVFRTFTNRPVSPSYQEHKPLYNKGDAIEAEFRKE